MAIGECPPNKGVYHAVIFVLFCTVISMQVHHFFTQSMHLEEVVETTDDFVGSFATLSSLLSEEIHLPRYRFTVDAKDSTLPRSKEVYRARLKRVRWKMDLLCIIKGEVQFEVVGVGWNFG